MGRRRHRQRPGHAVQAAGHTPDQLAAGAAPRGAGGVTDVYVKPSQFRSILANDLPASQAAELAATQRPIAASTLTDVSGPPAWASIPSWAVIGRPCDPAGGAGVHGTPRARRGDGDQRFAPVADLSPRRGRERDRRGRAPHVLGRQVSEYQERRTTSYMRSRSGVPRTEKNVVRSGTRIVRYLATRRRSARQRSLPRCRLRAPPPGTSPSSGVLLPGGPRHADRIVGVGECGGAGPAWDLTTGIDRTGWGFQLFLTAIRRSEPDEHGNCEWTLGGDGITISLGAPRFPQYSRRPPVHCPGHALSVEERGGFSFDRRSYTP